MRLMTLSVVVLLAFFSGCGGGTDDPGATGVKTYSNSDYSFSLQYPAAWRQGEPPSSPLMEDVEFSTAFADASNLEEARKHGEKVTAALVLATHVSRELTKAEWRKVLQASAAQMKDMPGSIPAMGYFDMDVRGSEMTRMCGAPCLLVDMTFSTAQDTRQHDRSYMFGKGDVYYGIQLSAAEDRWQEDLADLEAIAQSFTID